MTALFILKHFPTLLLIRVVIFGLTVPKLCQILLLNRGCARIQRYLIGLAVYLLQASRFICNFICGYFFKTFASPCRRRCVYHGLQLRVSHYKVSVTIKIYVAPTME